MKQLYTISAKDLPMTQLSEGGTLFKKQLLRFGDWIDPIFPEEVMHHDRQFMEQMVRNFRNKVVGRVPVPLTHTDNPEYNTGELVDLMIDGDGSDLADGLYGILDIRRSETAEDIANGLIWDVSISFTTHYTDNQTGEDYGPTLFHVALVNNPYIKKMSPFKALSDAVEKLMGKGTEVYALSEKYESKEIIMHKIKNEREFAVEITYSENNEEVKATLEPGQEIELSDETQAEAVKTQLSEAVAPVTEGEGEGKGEGEDKTELSEKQKRDLSELRQLRKEKRERAIEDLYQKGLSEGKLVPAQKDAFMELSGAIFGRTRNLSDGTTVDYSELLAKFVEASPKIVNFDESGKNTNNEDDPASKLSEETKQGLAKSGITPEHYIESGADKGGLSIGDLVNGNKEN